MSMETISILETQHYLIVILLILILTKLYQFISSTSTNHHLLLPPSPPALPIIGHLHLLSPALYKSFQNVSSKYGPLLYLRLGASHCLLVSSSSMAAEVFKTHDLTFASRPLFALSEKLPYGTSGFVTAPYGEYWRYMKKLCITELLSPRQLKRTRGIRYQELDKFLKKVMEKAEKKEMVDVGGELMRLTNNITCRMAMSTRCLESDGEAEKCKELVKESFELAAKMCFGDVFGRFKKLGFWIYGKRAMNVMRRYDELLERILKEHEDRIKDVDDEKDNKDMMDILLQVYHDPKAEVKITRTHIKAFFLDLFIAGTETTAQAMQWTIAELLNHPHIFRKVREEIESVVGRSRLVQGSDIPSLPYLQAVVRETLRLYPSGPVTTRECRQNCRIRGFDIPEKTAVAINLYAIMRDPESWDNPNEFHPERFLHVDGDDTKKEQTLFNFVPFGAGRRGCPGSTLAFTVMHTLIGAVVQCFDWKVDENGVDMEPGLGMSLGMVHPLKCVPLVHFNPFAQS